MSSSAATGPVRHSTFRASVRRLRREGLLTRLAELTAAELRRTGGVIDFDGMNPYPWLAGVVAREALLAPSNRRSSAAPPSTADVLALCALAGDLDERLLHGGVSTDDLHGFAVRTAYQQFPFSTRGYNDLARMYPLLDRNFGDLQLEVMSRATLEGVLGASLDVFVASAPFFGAAVTANAGQFDESWLAGPHFAPVRDRVDLEALVSVFHSAWATTFGDARAAAVASTSQDPLLRGYDYNPLVARPYVRRTTGDYVAPNAWWAFAHINRATVYYLGLAAHKEAWARDMGRVQERYVLEQVQQLRPTATALPEIILETRSGEVATVDALLIFDDLVVLLESKSLLATTDSTYAFDTYQTRLRRDLEKALGKQVPRTVGLIRGRHPALSKVPSDRRMVALVVTPEPLYLVNQPSVAAALPTPPVPTSIISLTQLEHLVAVALAERSSAVFSDATAATGSSSTSVDSVLEHHLAGRRPINPILEQGFARGPWTE